MIHYLKVSAAETEFILHYPDEVQYTEESEAENSGYTNLPYGFTFEDNLASVFEKLGNPDKYTKDYL